jgi:nitrite reductase/ring-hydroxylating ferredoxin subunit
MTNAIENSRSMLVALDRGESLPAHRYTDAVITASETGQIFRKSWSYIGPAQELANRGDYVTGYVGEVPAVVIRNESGLAGFVNVCRHRRHELMKGRGYSKIMQCGYHAWTYDLTGCLKAAPRSAAEPNFRLQDYPLVPLRVESLGPFVTLWRRTSEICSKSWMGAACTWNLWSFTIARSGARTPTGRPCLKIIWSAITAPLRILVSAWQLT